MTAILAIQAREIEFRTSTNCDWIDGLYIYASGAGGIVAGPENTGNGTILVVGVDPTVDLGPHLVIVTSVVSGLALFSVTNPGGTVTARGAAGVEAFAAGIRFTLMPGSLPFAVGDTFAVSILPVPVDLTGIRFDLQARESADKASIRLTASTAAPGIPTIVSGGAGGQIAMRVPLGTMSRLRPGSYPFDLVATANGVTVPAFYGTLRHAQGVSFLFP